MSTTYGFNEDYAYGLIDLRVFITMNLIVGLRHKSYPDLRTSNKVDSSLSAIVHPRLECRMKIIGLKGNYIHEIKINPEKVSILLTIFRLSRLSPFLAIRSSLHTNTSNHSTHKILRLLITIIRFVRNVLMIMPSLVI